MTNPYGITLDREWSEWAAKFGASPTVAAALFLISERHPSHEVMAKLTPGEVEQVAKIVRRWPDCFPPGSVDALKSRSLTLAQPPSVGVSADPTSKRRPARVGAESFHRPAHILMSNTLTPNFALRGPSMFIDKASLSVSYA